MAYDGEGLRDDRDASAFGRPSDLLYAVIGALMLMVLLAAVQPLPAPTADCIHCTAPRRLSGVH